MTPPRNVYTGRFTINREVATTEALSFVLPLPPNRGNARGSWRKTHFGMKAYWSLLDDYQACGLIPAPPKCPLAVASVTARLFLFNAMDTDGLMSRMKWVQDYLVKRGYIASDKPSALVYAGLPTQVIDRKRPRIELTLTELTEEGST